MDQLLLTINYWMMGNFALALAGCFLWGMVSVLLSPCHLASIPLLVGYVAGQDKMVQARQAAKYAVLFSLGLFTSIALVGLGCSLLGKMLGDISPYWGVPIGLVFMWIGLNLMGVQSCRMPGSHISRLQMRGYSGALILGLLYGILSGACTFGFIAPVLAMISVQGEMIKGLNMIVVFAIGHCLPIIIAGSSVALAQKLLAEKDMRLVTTWGRRVAGGLVVGIGLLVVISSFM